MEHCRIDMQAWRVRLPIVGRGMQLIRVDTNCQRKRTTAPLTLVLALVKHLALQAPERSISAQIGRFSRFLGNPIPGKYMHFSKS
jgi:hypothetical protein